MGIKEAEKLFLECKYDEAYQEFKKLADAGEARALYFLGEYCTWAYGHEKKDKVLASMYRKKGYESGDVLAGLNYAFSFQAGSFEKSRIFEEMVPKTLELAENGDVFAQNEIADCFTNGYAVPKDVEKGKEWLERSAEGGYARSVNKLGNAYYNGTYGSVDYVKAVELYQKAMEMGYPTAFYNMGNCFYNGYGVEQSYDKAIELYKKAYELGYSDAAATLADMYKTGTGVSENKELEIEWYTKGADLGNAECQFFLGRMYHLGTGVEIDYAKALKWYQLAADQGFAKAQNNLGNMYSDAQGVERNYAKAKELYYASAKGGCKSAPENIRRHLLVRAAQNSYSVSDAVKRKIQGIPSFKTDIYKIKSISAVKSAYGISDNETIISYRIVPKLLAKLETGGTVFTDQCVYKRLPSGLMSSDYVTYGIAYDEMIRYLPALGYSEKEQPQLVGNHESKENLSFWMTPVLGTESNSEIVDVFWSIIAEVSALDDEKTQIFSETQKNLLCDCNYFLESKGSFSSDDEEIIKQLIKRGLISPSYKEDAVYLIVANYFARGSYTDAYEYAEVNSAGLNIDSLNSRINALVRKTINAIGVPDSYGDVEALKLFGLKHKEYAEEVFPKVVTYYFNSGEYKSADDFMMQFQGEAFFDRLQEVLDSKITETLPVKIADWETNTYSSADEDFVIYAMNKPRFYKEAARGLVKHYCDLGRFDDALSSLDKVKEAENDVKFIEELKEFVSGYTTIYAANQYKKGLEYSENGDNRSAVKCLQEAVKYDTEKQEYVLTLIEMELKGADYALARTDISGILSNNHTFDEEGLKRFREMEIECAEGINKEMGAFYELLSNGNDSSLTSDSSSLSKVDQFGLSFYHYAILLQKEDVVERIDVSGTPARRDVCGYDIRYFGAGNGELSSTFVSLMRTYDDDAKQLYKQYKRKKAGNTAKEIGLGILESMMDQAISAAGNADSRLRQMERDRAYSSRWDEISDKRAEVQDKRDQMKDFRSQIRDFSDGNVESGDALWSEYVDNVVELSDEKVKEFSEALDDVVSSDDLRSKLIYLIIKNPSLLESIFRGDRSGFALHETKDSFWYLPESLIIDAENLSIKR